MKTYWHRRANISIGNVQTLPAGSNATASVTEDNVLSLGIPQGAKGDTGDTGPTMTYSGMSSADKTALTNAVASAIPYATASTKGVFKLGSGLAMSDGVLSATGNIEPIETMTGATASAAGTGGTVPAPAAGKQNAFLRGDATWAAAPYPGNATTSAAGLMSAADKTKLDGIAATRFTKIWGPSELYGSSNTPSSLTSLDKQTTYSALKDYDFLMVLYRNGLWNCESTLFPFKIAVAQYMAERSSESGSLTDAIAWIKLDRDDTYTNKNGGRRLTIYLQGNYTNRVMADNAIVKFYFEGGYYNGSANNGASVPICVYGIKL